MYRKGDVFVEDMGLFVSDKHQFLGACVDGKANYEIGGNWRG